MAHSLTVLILAGDVKGQRLITECKRQGCRVFVMTRHSLKDSEEWPRSDVDEFFYLMSLTNKEEVIRSVSYLCRTETIDRIIPLDDFDVEIASALREHMRMAGMGDTTARHFRDKLAMRVATVEKGILSPGFTGLFNHEAIHSFAQRVPAPWLLKPRSQAGSAGIKKVHSEEELWQLIDSLGDDQSNYILEQFIPGDIYHVDAITTDHQVRFVEVSKYGSPPLDIIQKGGIFMTSVMDRALPEVNELYQLNRDVLTALHLRRGVSHTEFIRSRADGRFYFLETGARVGGAYIADVVEHASGVNLWTEWAKLEIAGDQLSYEVPTGKKEYAGIVLCLARQEWPDMSGYQDPEIVLKVHKKNHAGIILASPDTRRLQQLLEDYSQRFTKDFLSSAPQYERIER